MKDNPFELKYLDEEYHASISCSRVCCCPDVPQVTCFSNDEGSVEQDSEAKKSNVAEPIENEKPIPIFVELSTTPISKIQFLSICRGNLCELILISSLPPSWGI